MGWTIEVALDYEMMRRQVLERYERDERDAFVTIERAQPSYESRRPSFVSFGGKANKT
jgi:hypothetical protein